MKPAPVILVAAFAVILAVAIIQLPPFGAWNDRDVANYYIKNGPFETGSVNVVNSIVWDFRGYDTLGEETVLLTAALGVFLIMRRMHYGHYRKKRK